MTTASPLRTAAVALLATTLAGSAAACSGGGTADSPFDRGEARSERAVIIVDNRNSAISEMTVYLAPRAGIRTRLGTVTVGQRETFTVEDLDWGSQFQLVGDPVGSGVLESRVFNLTQGSTVEWDVARNRIQFGGSAGG